MLTLSCCFSARDEERAGNPEVPAAAPARPSIRLQQQQQQTPPQQYAPPPQQQQMPRGFPDDYARYE